MFCIGVFRDALKDTFFDGDCPVDLRARVLKNPGTATIIGQYIGFSKVFNEQRKLHENIMDALEAAISISIESGYLAKYLTEHREKVVTMMAELFDEERLRAEDDDAVRAEEKISLARNLIRMGMGTLEKIAEATGLPLSKVQELAKGNPTIA